MGNPLRIGNLKIPEESTWGKELLKWEQPGYNPNDEKNRYPRMMYKAVSREETGSKIMCVTDPGDDNFGHMYGRCVHIVKSEQEAQHAKEHNGWSDSIKEALDAQHGWERDISDAAAHRHYEDRNLGEPAKREVAAAEEAAGGHLPEVPVSTSKKVPAAPRKKRGRPRKKA